MEEAADENIFKKVWFDPTYRIHNLCEPEKSGNHADQLLWSESADRLLKIIGNGVVKDGYNMFMAPGQARGLPSLSFLTSLFREGDGGACGGVHRVHVFLQSADDGNVFFFFFPLLADAFHCVV